MTTRDISTMRYILGSYHDRSPYLPNPIDCLLKITVEIELFGRLTLEVLQS